MSQLTDRKIVQHKGASQSRDVNVSDMRLA
jgi:hypothetical protein